MKPARFEYERPASVEEAVAALGRADQNARVLAGGQSLIPMMNLRMVKAERLIDIGRIESLGSIKEVGGELRIGSMVTHNTILSSSAVAGACPLLTEAYHQVAHHSVRNRGTLGGSLCHNDPGAEMPLIMSILRAILVARSTKGERLIAADDFFRGSFATALQPTELLVEIRIPRPPSGHGYAFLEVNQRKGDFALVACAAMLTIEGNTCRNVRVGYRSVGSDTARFPSIEALLEGFRPTPELFAQVAVTASETVNPTADIHADIAFRRDLVGTLTQRVLAIAAERAARR
jgi:CO/xanthine dehydrogenase FAD-binding subunit